MTEAVAVTGATGFIGRRLIEPLRAAGYRVHALERPTFDLERPIMADAFAGATTLVHAAAYVPRSMAAPNEAERCWRVNALGTQLLLSAAVAAGVARVVHVSTGNAYRPAPTGVDEHAALYPSARAPYYLTSKVSGEVFADHFHQLGKLRVAILRPSSVYGPGMGDSGLIPTFARRLRGGERITVQDGGRYQVDLVHVDDVVAAIVGAVSREATGPFNVGAGRAATTLEVAGALACLSGRDETAIEVVGDPTGTELLGFAALEIGRARAELGYAPRALVEGLRSYVASL